jgi:hypothetical protein
MRAAAKKKNLDLVLGAAESLAVEILADARRSAERHQRDVWDFAVELSLLLAAGITVTDLRSLVCQGVISHARELAAPAARNRRFRRLKNLGFPPSTCFILADHIAAPTRRASHRDQARQSDSRGGVEACAVAAAAPAISAKPSWDRAARTLLLDGRVIKQLRVPARCQEIVLGVFEESGWPRCIDDPLPPNNGEDAKYRLYNTIKALNGHHLARRLHFTSNGDGTGVCWELVELAATRRPPARRGAQRRRSAR